MGWARIDDDGTLYFSTGADSKKIAELEAHPEVTLSVQGKADYAVVRGTARISQDRALIRELWEDSWKVWFPEGVDDPTIAIVVVSPDEGTYWDQKSTQGLSFLFRLAKARLTGNAVEIEQGDVQHVPLR
jgi:general stress protein 26